MTDVMKTFFHAALHDASDRYPFLLHEERYRERPAYGRTQHAVIWNGFFIGSATVSIIAFNDQGLRVTRRTLLSFPYETILSVHALPFSLDRMFSHERRIHQG